MEGRTQTSLEAFELWPWPSLSRLGPWITSNTTLAIHQVKKNKSVSKSWLIRQADAEALWDQFASDKIIPSVDTSSLHLHQLFSVSSPTRCFGQIPFNTQYPSPVFSHHLSPLDPPSPHQQYNFNNALIAQSAQLALSREESATNLTTAMSSPFINTSTTDGELPYALETQNKPPFDRQIQQRPSPNKQILACKQTSSNHYQLQKSNNSDWNRTNFTQPGHEPRL